MLHYIFQVPAWREIFYVESYLEREGSLWFFLRGLLGYRNGLRYTCWGLPRRCRGYWGGGTDFFRTVPPRCWRGRRLYLTLQPAQPACLVKYSESATNHRTPWKSVSITKFYVQALRAKAYSIKVLANYIFFFLANLLHVHKL